MADPMWPSGPDVWHQNRDDPEADERQERQVDAGRRQQVYEAVERALGREFCRTRHMKEIVDATIDAILTQGGGRLRRIPLDPASPEGGESDG